MNRRKERIDRGVKARSADIFALTSYREMLYLLIPGAIPVVGLLCFAPILSDYWREVMISTAIYALLAMSWDMLMCAGLLSLGQSLFFGIGSYLAGSLNYYAGLPPILTMPIATIGGGVLCTILLLPVLRLRGVYFAMVTLVLPLMLSRLVEATRILGGTEGLTGLTPFPNQLTALFVIQLALLAVLFGFRRIMGSDYGLVIKGISDNDRSVMSAGPQYLLVQNPGALSGGLCGMFCRRFRYPYGHVRGDARVCPGLFHHAGGRSRCGRDRDLCGSSHRRL